ncbi:tetratricopeptide repeat protein [Stutzerimonas stutzeri]|uniref:tetratricopeptide repeat protein n=1 Tax=Stutzerimonas stutzeri TaxID=316 RepID=UPI001C2E68EC|nr:tetratricopeptide repeat protein [Stutzerimonas stutzeri]
MSLVNDMLRDLDARRAAPAERQQLGSLHAVDEAGAARRGRLTRLWRGVSIMAAIVLLAAALWLLSDRLRPAAEPAVVAAPAPVAPAAAEPVAPMPEANESTRLLEVLPQNDGRRFLLQLLLDHAVSYERTDTSGSVSFRLEDVRYTGEARSGRIEKDGQTLSWRVEAQGDDVQVLLVGFGDRLSVADRLEFAGDRSQLWLDVPLSDVDEAEAQSISMPVAEPAEPDEAQLPDWVTQEVAPAEAPREPARVARQTSPRPAPSVEPAAPAGPKTLSIGTHKADALVEARQALARGDHLRAIEQLQALQLTQPDNPEVARWLAQAYLAAGDTAALLRWLPAQLQARPFDAALRELLARGQLQVGDPAAAIATLQQNAPELRRNTSYHALLAALYQQVGDWASSAASYRQLVAVRPDQAAWHLGLAIALEQLDQPAQAGQHYRQALQGQGLDSSARQFASERAGSLGVTQ